MPRYMLMSCSVRAKHVAGRVLPEFGQLQLAEWLPGPVLLPAVLAAKLASAHCSLSMQPKTDKLF